MGINAFRSDSPSIDRRGFPFSAQANDVSTGNPNFFPVYLSAAISAATSFARKMDVPATMTFAPASRDARAVATLIPPSTSMW